MIITWRLKLYYKIDSITLERAVLIINVSLRWWINLKVMVSIFPSQEKVKGKITKTRYLMYRNINLFSYFSSSLNYIVKCVLDKY